MKNLILLFFICYFLNAENISSPTKYIPQEFDVISYQITIEELRPAEKFISAYNDISFVWTRDNKDSARYFKFHLDNLKIDSILLVSNMGNIPKLDYKEYQDNSSDLPYFRIADPEINDSIIKFRIYYSGTMLKEIWGGIHYDDQILYNMGVGFQNQSVSAARNWYPCYDHPSDKATFEVSTGLLPTPNLFVSNGVSLGGIGLDTLQSHNYKTEYPIATYLTNFVYGELEEYSPTNYIPSNIYFKEKYRSEAEYSFQNLDKMILALEHYFGKYPFEKIDYVLTAKGAMEHQTLINISNNTVKDYHNTKNLWGDVISHELGHQWFGNCITPYDFRDTWLNESFATFCEAVVPRYWNGLVNYTKKIREDGNYYINNVISSEGHLSLYDFDRFKASNYPTTIYKKGSVVLSMLKDYIGNDTLFFKGLKTYYELNKYSNVNTDEFKSIMEDITEKNLTNFFNQWIYENGFPYLTATIKGIGEKSFNLSITQTQAKPFGLFTDFILPVNYLTKAGNKKEKRVIINLEQENFLIEDYEEIDFTSVNINQSDSIYSLCKITKVLSVNEQIDEIFTFYDNKIQISVKNTIADVYIYDINGRIIFKEKFSNNLIIDISNFEKNVYIINVGNNFKKFLVE